jgi:N-acetylglucosaminyldiphosphoundecaprenol N-acetyl-beta-D-mannosaminyltransferase
MHAYLLKQAQEHQLKVFYMGSSDETLFKIKERIQKEYPAISCGTYSPPYKAVFSEEDKQAMRDAINSLFE